MASKISSRPTLQDVARLAGVSPAAASFMLNGRSGGEDRISPDTRRRIQQAVEELGYVPNQAARSLRRQRTDRVCLMVPRLGVPQYNLMAQSLQTAAEVHGCSIVIVVGGTVEREQQVLEQLRRGLADGALLAYPDHLTNTDLARLAQSGLAVVALSNHLQPDGFDVVSTTEGRAVQAAVRYLAQQGRRRIAFLGSTQQRTTHRDRLVSFRQALQELGLPDDPDLIIENAGEERGEIYRSAAALLQNPVRPDAIFAPADVYAMSAAAAALDAGLRVPQDVAVIGSGNIPEGELFRPALTTIGMTSFKFNDLTDLLFCRLAGEGGCGQASVREWQLILRSSA